MTDAAAVLNVAVFGAGSVGCYVGGHLAGVCDVTLVGRAAAMETVRERGLTLTASDADELRVKPGALRTASDATGVRDADYVLVTVKSAATREAAEAIRPHLRDGAVIVSFQNGLRNPGILREALPGHEVLTGMVPYNVLGVGPGTYHRGVGGALMLDEGAAGARLAGALRDAGLEAETRADMREVQYGKLLLNLNNAVNALSGLPLREQLAQRAYRRCLAQCQEEALAVFRAAGVEPAHLGPAAPDLIIDVLRLPDDDYRQLAAASLDIDATARSSMWEDFQRGRPTEIDTLQGEIVALAAAHGLEAPANARMTALVHEAERAGEPPSWPGPELLAALTQG
ncbi:2-dehydropantoate 2-reductase [Streptomyces albiaxialis]|uniref:2-dehydropantoate 2-reductase n=1 Tax=Streptomyces albiaxialis TaxID=329523 RepID=UPI0031DFE8E0